MYRAFHSQDKNKHVESKVAKMIGRDKKMEELTNGTSSFEDLNQSARSKQPGKGNIKPNTNEKSQEKEEPDGKLN